MKLLSILEQDYDIATDIELHKNEVGLSTGEVVQRQREYGENRLEQKQRVNPFLIFFSQYKDIMTVILLICTAVSIFMGEYFESLTIAAIVLLNGVLGFIQEYRTEKTLDALKNMASPTARVYRNGKLVREVATGLVPDDVIELKAGDKIPADGILLTGAEVKCDETMLTGESHPVKKNEMSKNQLYMGCAMLSGHCRMRVTRIGMQTKMGEIAGLLQTIKEEPTPLQKRLSQLSKYIAIGCLLICAIVSATGILRGENVFDMLITGVSLAVAAVPEGLVAIVTISLALSVGRMVKRNALVRRLHAVETLGCATVICSDKTGTITKNSMTAVSLATAHDIFPCDKLDSGNKTVELSMLVSALCNNSQEGSNELGDPTERALMTLANSHGYTTEGLKNEYERLFEQPFDSERKRMSVVIKNNSGEQLLMVKGGFDLLLDRCIAYHDGSVEQPLTPAVKRKIMEHSTNMAGQALRIIGLAYKKISPISPSRDEDKLTFLSLVGMIDPPRPEVKRAVAKCRRAGIKTVMITGDYEKTAVAIARQVGIFKDGDMAVTGEQLESMSVDQLAKIVNSVTVFSRVSPSHKLQIVKALKRNGHIVAMTGDGVNDAPAIKEADIGVAMGKNGSDVTKEAAEIILLDDNFATLVNATEEGRSIYNNIRKFIRYLLSCNIGEVVTMFFGMLMGMPVILLPIQILLINLVTDGLPAIALGLEPSDEGAMSRPPRKPNESVFSHGLAGKIAFRGVLIGLATLASFVSLFKSCGDVVVARSGALFALVFAQLLHAFECKSEDKGLFSIHLFNNKKLLAAVSVSLIVLLCVIYVPAIATVFSVTSLTLSQVIIPIGYCIIVPFLTAIFSKK